MPLFKDRAGKLWEFDTPDDATRQGMVEASDADIDAHNHAIDVEESGKGTSLQSVAEGAARAAMLPGMALTEALTGQKPGQTPQDQLPADQQSALGESVMGPEAKLRAEAHPMMAGLGGGSVAAVAGVPLGMAATAGLGGGLAAGAAGVLTEAAVGGIQQEYDDAWLADRPYQLKNVAANTLMFAGGDFLFRGALKGIGLGLSKGKGLLGGRNIVSEAQGAAREIVRPTGAHSVGAASAADMAEPFDDAIKQMSDKSAAVLARDADDHIHLVSQDASESFTRLNDGISDSLGTQLKHEDIAQYAAELDDKTLARQAKWLTDMADQGDAAARQIASFTEGNKGALDFGNLGKKAVSTIDDFNHRISNEVDAGSRNILVDEYKKRLDALTMSIDGSHTVDGVTRKELKALIAPVREGLRKGLENAKYFGGAADLQKALNPGWHQFLEHWPKVQQSVLEATGHVKFDVGGAGRITKESTVDRMLALLGKDPRSNQEFGKHLRGAFEGLQQLIDAREANGIVRKEGLETMRGDLRNLMEDWNLASTVGVAKNRVAAMRKDPRKWASLALDMAEGAPMVGKPIRVLRSIGDAMTDLHLPQNEPVGQVWDSAYKRFALNPAYQDPSIIRNYPDWIADAMRNRGGNVPPTPPSGVRYTPGVPDMAPANEIVQDAIHEEQLGLSAIERAKRRASQGGNVTLSRGPSISGSGHPAIDKELTKLARKLESSERFAKKGESLSKQWSDASDAADAAEERVADLVNEGADKSEIAVARKSAKAARNEEAKLQQKMDRAEELAPKLDNELDNLSSAFDEAMADLDEGDPLRAKLESLQKSLDETRNLNTTAEDLVVDGQPTRYETEDGATSAREFLAQFEQLQPSKAGERGFVDFAGGVAKSPLGLVTAAAAGLGANYAIRHEDRPPPPAQTPDVAYRDAIREIEQAGQQTYKTFATEALRKSQPRGKDKGPLALFAGKQSLQDAVEETRERLDEIAGDPTSLIKQLSNNAGDIRKTHPSVYSAMVEKAATVAAYLQQSLPQKTATTLLDQRGGALSFDRAWDYAARFVGATNPRAALREVVRGNAPPEMIEAVAQNWPEVWDGFRVEVLGQVQRMSEAGRHIPSEKLRRLDAMLGLGGQLDPSATVDVAKHFIAAQDAEAQKRQQAGQSGSAMPSSAGGGAAFRTRLDSINAGE